jgi:hypothetical protein
MLGVRKSRILLRLLCGQQTPRRSLVRGHHPPILFNQGRAAVQANPFALRIQLLDADESVSASRIFTLGECKDQADEAKQENKIQGARL